MAEARRRRALLLDHEARLRTLVERCVQTVDPAPRMAVPDVAALGPVPNTLEALEAYLLRLDRVERALAVLERAYGDALARHAELAARLAAYHAKATATGAAQQPDVARAHDLAREALARRPTQMAIAEQLVLLYQAYLRSVPAGARSASPPERTTP